MKTIKIGIGLSVMLISSLLASTEVELKKDLTDSLTRLKQVREKVAEEKPKLGKEVAERERELVKLRRQHRLAQLSEQAYIKQKGELAREHGKYAAESDYLGGVYRSFCSQLQAQWQVGERQLYDGKLAAALAPKGTQEDQAMALDLAMDRLESMLGGRILQGTAVDHDGLVVEGKIASIGPATWFQSNDGKTVGALIFDKGSLQPHIAEADEEKVAALFNGEPTELSVDVTGGSARAIAEIEDDVDSILKKGGIWLWPILGIAFVSVICGVLKMIQLQKIKLPRAQWVADILAAVREDKLEEAKEIAGSVSHPAGQLLQAAIGYTKSGVDVVEEVIYEELIGVQARLQKWLSFISVTAATAPLLGLLGTVSGMIRMFNVITVTGTGDVKPMAGGISEALVTTLFGLIVAIPALILHSILARRSLGVVQNTEKLGLTFVNGLRKSH